MSNYTKSTNFATKDNLTPGDPLKVVRGTEIDTEFNNIATAIATKTDNSAAAITGGSITGITDLAIADGGTGASTATAALNNLLPSQTGNANKYLQTDGTNATWDAVSLSTADITGTLPVANGGTGVTSSTGTGSVVLSNSPTLVTPALGTPASGVATNLTGLPISTGVSGLGTGVATFLGTPSSANLASAVSDETGTGSLVFANSPTLVTPALGTPSALVGTNITGTASGLTAGNVTTNANLTGAVTSVGNATSLGSFSSANLLGALTDETGTGSAVFATSPTLVTPILGTPTSATLTNATGLPISTGVSGLGTGVATALAVNVGSSGAPLVNGGVLGTPSSGTATNLTGLPLTTGVTGTLPTANGGTNLTSFTSGGVVYASSSSALATGSALTFSGSVLGVTGAITTTDNITITKPTGVPRIQIVATTGTNEAYLQATNTGGSYYVGAENSAGSWFGATAYALAISAPAGRVVDTLIAGSKKTTVSASGLAITGTLSVSGVSTFSAGTAAIPAINTTGDTNTGIFFPAADTVATSVGGSEGMRLTSTGLGIGTSSPARKLDAQSTTADYQLRLGYNSSFYYDIGRVNSNGYLGFYGSQTGATGFTFGGVDGTRMTLDSAGNLGLGVTPSAWNTIKPIEIARAGSFVGANSSGSTYLGANTRFASGWIYANTGAAGLYTVEDNTHFWRIAGSGTAGNAISFTQALTLHASGGLSLGNTSDYGAGNLSVTGKAKIITSTTINSSTATTVTTQSSGAVLLRDNTNGGTALVITDTTGGLVIVSQVGSTTYVTTSPTATQIQVTNNSGNIQCLGGSSRNAVSIVTTALQLD